MLMLTLFESPLSFVCSCRLSQCPLKPIHVSVFLYASFFKTLLHSVISPLLALQPYRMKPKAILSDSFQNTGSRFVMSKRNLFCGWLWYIRLQQRELDDTDLHELQCTSY